jgi:hypothetical protein
MPSPAPFAVELRGADPRARAGRGRRVPPWRGARRHVRAAVRPAQRLRAPIRDERTAGGPSAVRDRVARGHRRGAGGGRRTRRQRRTGGCARAAGAPAPRPARDRPRRLCVVRPHGPAQRGDARAPSPRGDCARRPRRPRRPASPVGDAVRRSAAHRRRAQRRRHRAARRRASHRAGRATDGELRARPAGGRDAEPQHPRLADVAGVVQPRGRARRWARTVARPCCPRTSPPSGSASARPRASPARPGSMPSARPATVSSGRCGSSATGWRTCSSTRPSGSRSGTRSASSPIRCRSRRARWSRSRCSIGRAPTRRPVARPRRCPSRSHTTRFATGRCPSRSRPCSTNGSAAGR